MLRKKNVDTFDRTGDADAAAYVGILDTAHIAPESLGAMGRYPAGVDLPRAQEAGE